MVRRIAVATVTVGVSIVAGCGLFLGEPEIGSGSLSITSWAEDFAQEGIDGLDPNESVNSVLIVEPEIDGKTVFLTGEGGALDIDNVPVGDYTVRPLHAGSDYARSVTVAGGETVEIEVPTPSAGIYFYFFNHDSTDPPFNSTDVRQAFNIAIDRDSIVDYLADDPDLDFDTAPTAAYSYIPTSLQESDWEVATIPDDDTVGANELLESQDSPFSFEVLYNLVDDQEIPHGSIA
ncbi:MAG: ABC transporter substrate-binding protein, partial [Spirochaetaceae bacterium]